MLRRFHAMSRSDLTHFILAILAILAISSGHAKTRGLLQAPAAVVNSFLTRAIFYQSNFTPSCIWRCPPVNWLLLRKRSDAMFE